MASGCLPFRNSLLPDSRSLVIFAERFGLTGIGGGGTGDSSVSNERWMLFSVASSSWRARELLVDVIALDCGSICSGSSVKVSVSSMVDSLYMQYLQLKVVVGVSVLSNEICFLRADF